MTKHEVRDERKKERKTKRNYRSHTTNKIMPLSSTYNFFFANFANKISHTRKRDGMTKRQR